MIQENRLVQQFVTLVGIDAPSKAERQMADTIIGQLRQMGFAVEEDQAGAAIGGNCNNVRATLPGGLDLPPLLFCAHFDTVEPSCGKTACIGADGIIRSKGDTVLGADDLGGLVPILEAIRSLQEDHRPHRPIELLLTVAEEQHLLGSNNMKPGWLTAREGYILDMSGEPGLGILRAPGHIGFVFEIQGKASHAGIAPEKGISAITVAAKGIAAMRLGKVDAATTANIGQICGGGETNIVAESCRVTAECRSLDQAKLEEQAADMCACMEAAAASMGAAVTISRDVRYHPYELDKNDPVVVRFTEACRLLGLPCRLESGGGGSDNNVLMRQNVTGMVLSCGMMQVHSCREQISIRDLVNTARLVETLITLP